MLEDLTVLSHPDDWDQQHTWRWVGWVRMGQVGLLDDNQRFQFVVPGPSLSKSRLRRDIHPDSDLRYGPDARMFLGRLTREGSDDPVAQNERRNYFIKSPRALNTKLFTDEAETYMLQEGENVTHIKTLLESVIRYEARNPVRVSDSLTVAHRRTRELHSGHCWALGRRSSWLAQPASRCTGET